MPKKAKKQRMIRMRATKEKKDKDKNKIKKSVKINITSSGGGGSGGSGIPSIPQPIYNSMQGQKTGENVETNNLIRQLIQTQQPIRATPIIQQPIIRESIESATPLPFEGDFIPLVEKRDLRDYSNQTLLQNINRNSTTPRQEEINNDDINDEANFINEQIFIQQNKIIKFNMHYKNNKKELDKANENLLISSIEQKVFTQAKKMSNLPLGVFISSNGKKYVAKYRKDHIGTFDSPEEASAAYEQYKSELK